MVPAGSRISLLSAFFASNSTTPLSAVRTRKAIGLLALAGTLAVAGCSIGGGNNSGGGGGGQGGGGGSTTYTLSGAISGTQQASISLSGAASATATTDANGNYSFASLGNGSYTVTPSESGYLFTPANLTATINGANFQLKTIQANQAYTLSGTVTGDTADGVTIALSGPSSATTTTASGGRFSFTMLASGNYTLTPSETGFMFSPLNLPVNLNNNLTSQNFTAKAEQATYVVSGTVSGTAPDGVLIALSGTANDGTTTTGQMVTAGGGQFSFSGVAGGTYSLTPSLATYTFSPADIGVTVNAADAAGQDFKDKLSGLTLKWKYATGDAIYYSSPAIGADGTIYVGNGAPFALGVPRNFYAFNPDGSVKWSYLIGVNTDSPVVAPDGTVYVQDTLSTLYAFDPGGTLKWKYPLQCSLDVGQVVPALGSDGTIYLGADGLYAIDPGTGTMKWHVGVASAAGICSSTWGYGQVRSGPAVGPDGTIYAAVNVQSLVNAAVIAVSPAGTIKWELDLGGIDPGNVDWMFSSPAIASDGTIYIGSETGMDATDVNTVFALNPDGSIKWTYGVPGGRTIRSSPTIGADGTIYIGAKAGNTTTAEMVALNPDGTLKWIYPLALAGADIYSTPTVAADGRIFFGAETSLLYALNPDGTLSDTYDTNNGINWTSPAIAGDGTIYIGNNAGDFFAIGSGSLGLAKSSWPKFHQNNQNTGLYSGKAQGSAQPGPAIDSQP